MTGPRIRRVEVADGDLHAFSPYGVLGASTRVRLLEWLDHLGLDAVVHGYADLGNNRPGTVARHPLRFTRAELSLRRMDMAGKRVVMSREASPFSLGLVEERLLRRADHSVYDFDDALFDDYSLIRRP